jgi:hypothetical protein
MNIVDGDHLLNWLLSVPVYAVLVDGRHYRWQPEHRWLSDITGQAGFHEMLVGKIVQNRTFFANDVRFLAVTFPASAVAVYVKGPSVQQSPVICYADVLVGLPAKGDGGDIIMPFSHGVLRV